MTTKPGIAAFAVYVPASRLDRADVARALRVKGGRGTRAVASYDEDTTSLAVEAARRIACDRGAVEGLYFATTAPAYADKTNATAVHAALGLDTRAFAFDLIGSVRNGVAAIRAGFDAACAGRQTLVAVADMRSGRPGSQDETDGGDASAAFVFDDKDVLAELLGVGSASSEFLSRWRSPAETSSHVWEERFGEETFLPLIGAAVADALKESGLAIGEVDHVIVTGPHSRANRRVGAALGVQSTVLTDDHCSEIGNTGCAHGSVLLCDVLDHASGGEVILLVSLADGVDAVVFRTTELLVQHRDPERVSVAAQISGRTLALDYPTFLTWRGVLEREPPRRPEIPAPAAPPSLRTAEWKFGFVGSTCDRCSMRHLPAARVCVNCRAVDQQSPTRFADLRGRIATFSIDRLEYSMSPPTVVAVVDFDGGGRYPCAMTDVDPDSIAIGDRVEMSFRRISTSGGVHNYFWKARPVLETSGSPS